MTRLLMLIAVVAGCGNDCPASAPSAVSATAIPLGGECVHAHDPARPELGSSIGFVATIRVRYAKTTYMEAMESVDLYSFQCDEETKRCSVGVSVDLDAIAEGKPVSYLSVLAAEGAELLDAQGDSVFTIGWGPLRRFTIDIPRKTITFVERRDGEAPVDGHGEVACKTSM